MKINIYDFEDYKEYVKAWIKHNFASSRGVYGKIAEFMRVHPAQLSRVFGQDHHLTTEQSLQLAQFLKLNTSEEHYFILLVKYERAETAALKSLYHKEIFKIKSKKSKSKKMAPVELSDENWDTFFANPHNYLAYLALSLRNCQHVDELTQRLKISKERVTDALKTLKELDLIEKRNEGHVIKRVFNFCPPAGHIERLFHTDQRIEALNREYWQEDELHSTQLLTMKYADYKKILIAMKEVITEISDQNVAKNSDEIVLMTVDLLRL